MKAIRIDEKFAAFTELWRPKVIAELNGQEVKVVKVQGVFPWHKHDDVDEFLEMLEKGRSVDVAKKSNRGKQVSLT